MFNIKFLPRWMDGQTAGQPADCLNTTDYIYPYTTCMDQKSHELVLYSNSSQDGL